MKIVLFVLVACAAYSNCDLSNFHCPKVEGKKDLDLAKVKIHKETIVVFACF
jgi:hypothetical protein